MTLARTEPEMSKARVVSYDNRYLLPKNEAVQQIVLKIWLMLLAGKISSVRFPILYVAPQNCRKYAELNYASPRAPAQYI